MHAVEPTVAHWLEAGRLLGNCQLLVVGHWRKLDVLDGRNVVEMSQLHYQAQLLEPSWLLDVSVSHSGSLVRRS